MGLPATMVHSFRAFFLSIILCLTGRTVCQHGQLQPRIATVSVCWPGKAPGWTELSPGPQSLLPPVLLPGQPIRPVLFIKSSVGSCVYSINPPPFLPTLTSLFLPFPADPRSVAALLRGSLGAFATLCLCSFTGHCLKNLPFLSKYFPKQKRQACLAEKIQCTRCYFHLWILLTGPQHLASWVTWFYFSLSNQTIYLIIVGCVYIFIPSEALTQRY